MYFFSFIRGELEEYMRLLVSSFNASTVSNLMCGNLVSVAYDGRVFDCDFNQQLDIPVKGENGNIQNDSEQ